MLVHRPPFCCPGQVLYLNICVQSQKEENIRGQEGDEKEKKRGIWVRGREGDKEEEEEKRKRKERGKD